ncbi:MAG: hypothetical protein ABL959_18060, partial [Pyrinomonadaceae bacterium]
MSEHELEVVKKSLPNIPEEYTRVVADWNLTETCIGMFRVFPGGGGGLVQELLTYNDPAIRPFAEKFLSDGAYQVAAFDADSICIVFRQEKY